MLLFIREPVLTIRHSSSFNIFLFNWVNSVFPTILYFLDIFEIPIPSIED